MPSKMIGKLSLNNELLQKDLEVVDKFPVIEEEYTEFGVGIWKNHSLWNESGDFKNTQYRDYNTPIKLTELGRKLPYINSLITENFDTTNLKMVRGRNLINGLVIPHKDFVELSKPKECYLRIFIPLENNQNAYHSDENSVFQMQKAEVWRLDASIIHAAANFGTDNRLHLCLDFQFDKAIPYGSVFLDQKIPASVVAPTMPIRNKITDLDLKLEQLSNSINTTNLLEVVAELSKLHFKYDVSIADCKNGRSK